MGIALSEVAAEEIRRIIVQQGLDAARLRLRVAVKGSGPKQTYVLDLTQKTDEQEVTFGSQGIQIACDRSDVERLEGATIDFRDEAEGRGFVFDVPPRKYVTQGQGDHDALPPTRERVNEALRSVIDPEVGLNIVDLGLIYELTLDGRAVYITMTMTTPACPMTETIKRDIHERISEACPGVDSIEVQVVWEPRWTSDRISEAGKQQLGWGR